MTTRQTLTSEPDSMLATMFAEESPFGDGLIDERGARFIDADPSNFRIILQYLRYHKLVECPPEGPERARLLQEAHYFGLMQLVDEICGWVDSADAASADPSAAQEVPKDADGVIAEQRIKFAVDWENLARWLPDDVAIKFPADVALGATFEKIASADEPVEGDDVPRPPPMYASTSSNGDGDDLMIWFCEGVGWHVGLRRELGESKACIYSPESKARTAPTKCTTWHINTSAPGGGANAHFRFIPQLKMTAAD